MLSVYTGRGRQSLEDVLFEKIKERLALMRGGAAAADRIILVVPAQFTLKAEQLAFERLGEEGFFDLQIVSGNKLEQDIIRETGGPGLTPVNTLGRTMLLRKVASDRAPQLKRFSKVAGSREFLKLAGDFIVQMKQNGLAPEDLGGILEDIGPSGLLSEKLSDMKLIAEGYEEAMEGRFTDSEDLLAFVTEKIKSSAYVRGSEIWYHGFYSFTKRDCAFLAALAKYSKGLSMMLPLGSGREGDEELYAAPIRTLSLLKAAAAEERLSLKTEAISEKAEEETLPVIIRCSNPFSQAETIAAEILRLMREEKVGAGEIAVLTADAPGRTETLARVLESFEIPVFMDSKRSVMHSPAATLVTALLDMAAEGLKASNVISFMKQGLAGGDGLSLREEFEVYIRNYKLRGKAFLSPLRYGADRLGEEKLAELEKLREELAALISPWLEAEKAAKTCEGKCRALYNYLDDTLNLPRVLESTAAALAAEDMADAAEETAQAWKSITSLLDQTVALMGSLAVSSGEFRDMMEDALSDISIGVLPQSEGRVQLGTVSRSRLEGVRVLFAADMNDGLIPKDSSREALLTEKELEGLEDLGFTLSKRNELLGAEEKLAVHLALSAPAEKKYYCWCGSDPSGEGLKPSPIIAELKERHPSLTELYDLENRGDTEGFIQSSASARSRLLTELRKAADSGRGAAALDPAWKAVFNRLKDEGDPAATGAGNIVFYDISSPALPEETVKDLFSEDGSDFSFSASRLENYASCPFRHFVRYGLFPEEDRLFEIDSPAVGTVYHEALLRLSRRLSEPAVKAGIDITDPASLWMTVTDEELSAMLASIIEDLRVTGLGGLLSAGAAESYRVDRMQKVCLEFARRMVAQVRKGRIGAMYFETGFGRGKRFPSIKVETSRGTVHVEGRIDRIDLLRGEDGSFIKIIDYKSGSTKFDKSKVRRGLALQLSTYLEGALGDGRSKPAGMFYFRIADPAAEASLDEVTGGKISSKVIESIEKDYALSGMVVDDAEVLNAIDSGIAGEGRSDIINYELSSKGTVKCPALVSPEELDSFREEFRQALNGICKSLTDGEISPRPRNIDRGVSSCARCDYRSICLYGVD